MVKCNYCINGVQVYGTECVGIGPTRVYKLITGVCWDCQGTGQAPEPPVFHGWDQASLDSTLGKLK